MPDLWGIAAILSKLLLYAGGLGASGLVLVQILYARLVGPVRVQTALLAGLALGAAVLGYLLRGAALTGDAGGMTDPQMLGLLWQTPVGTALQYRVAGLALIAAGVFVPRIGPWLALAGGALTLWSFAEIGHVPDLAQPGIRLLLVLHLLGVAFWIGILAPLRRLARRPGDLARAAQLGHRFGQTAAYAVPALILAGLLMGWLLLGDLRALVMTGYGRALMLKLALVGMVLMLAAANKLRLVPAMRRGDPVAARKLVRSIEFETVVLLAVLAVTATLTSTLTLPS